MADSVEMQDIRGLDIDKLAKGFADQEYQFKGECQVSSMTGDSVRWYSKTAGTLTATSPSVIKNVSPLAQPDTIEQTWTRNTSYMKKYMVEGFISNEDIKSADLDVLATTVRDLTRAIVSSVDKDIYNVMTEDSAGTPTPDNTQTAASTAAWDAGSGQNPIKDILNAQRLLFNYNYDAMSAVMYLNPANYQALVVWLVSTKGSSIPNFASNVAAGQKVISLMGMSIKVSNNVTDNWALVMIPKRACTFKQYTPTSSVLIDDPMIGKKIRVSEAGIAYLTDPKAIVQISAV